MRPAVGPAHRRGARDPGDSAGIGFLEQALAIRHEIGDRMGEAQAANNLADAYRVLGRLTEVLELQRRALAANRAVG